MKHFTVLCIFAVIMTAAAFTGFTQDKGKGNNKEKHQNKGKDKREKSNDNADRNNGNGQKENKSNGSWNNSSNDNRNDEDKIKKNEGRQVNSNNNDRDGYFWDRETFKERKKIKSQEKVTICHKFNSNEPAVTIRVSSNALKAHINHGDVTGTCPAVADNRFSDVFLRKRSDYYNDLQNSQEQVVYSRSILDYALARLAASRSQLALLQSNNMPVADIQRKQATVAELEQNTSLLQTLLGVAVNVLANKLQ